MVIVDIVVKEKKIPYLLELTVSCEKTRSQQITSEHMICQMVMSGVERDSAE